MPILLLLVLPFYTTARVNTVRFSAVGVGVILSILLLFVPPFTLRRGQMLPVFCPLCRRWAAHFNAVGAVFYTTAKVNAARFSAVGVGVMLPIFLLFVAPFTLRRGKMLPVFRPLV